MTVYNVSNGRCKMCLADTLWGDAPHDKACEYANSVLAIGRLRSLLRDSVKPIIDWVANGGEVSIDYAMEVKTVIDKVLGIEDDMAWEMKDE